MALTMRPTRLASPASKDWADYTIYEKARAVGRIYEDRRAPLEFRWRWFITVHVRPKHRIPMSGRAESLNAAKAAFKMNWDQARATGA